jgi:hypothetical protein
LRWWILLENTLAGAGLDLLFEFLDGLAISFKHLEIVVNHAVENGVAEIPGPRGADPPAALAQTLPHRLQHVTGSLLEAQQEVGADHQADLFRVQPASSQEAQHADHDVEVVPVILDLGPLVRVDDVLHDQRVQAEVGAQFLHQIDLVKAVDVDPGHRFLVPVVEAFVIILDGTFLYGIPVVVDELDFHLVDFSFTNEGDGARRLCGRLVGLVEDSHHVRASLSFEGRILANPVDPCHLRINRVRLNTRRARRENCYLGLPFPFPVVLACRAEWRLRSGPGPGFLPGPRGPGCVLDPRCMNPYSDCGGFPIHTFREILNILKPGACRLEREPCGPF